jgi:hypothetical protein
MASRQVKAVKVPAKANGAPADYALCAQRAPKPVVLPEGLSPIRASAIRLGAKKWVNGTVLHYHFLEDPAWVWADAQKDVVRWAARTWIDVGIGLSLIEVGDPTEAEILIGFLQSDGSWSLVGTDNLDSGLRDQGRTLNYAGT